MTATASRLLLLAKNRAGYLRLCELLSAAYLAPRRHGRAEIKPHAFADGRQQRPDRARPARRLATSARRCWPASSTRPRLRPAPGPRSSPAASIIEVQRPAAATARRQPEALVAADRAAGGRLELPLVATHPVQFIEPRRLQAPTRRASASPRATCWPTRAGRSASARSSTSRPRPRWRNCSPTCPRRWRTRSRSRAAATCRVELGKNHLPRVSRRPSGVTLDELPAPANRAPGWSSAWRSSIPMRPSAKAERPHYAERLEFEIKTIQQMGFPGYFLIVADFINWAKTQRRAGRPGPRLRRRLAGGLQPRHHRSRSAALRAAVRALPQSRAGVDARLRHRLLPGGPRPRHRLRASTSTAPTPCRRSPPSAPWRPRR